ncbi:hypothetical protein BN14_05081 [Rhizoctonia solani AG-1 IB]|uniref:Uncharacterized protein n=1 Tax=Thanatephorus cucumeris (strain AG1-IB / isolate 7/3/14) TaxID=1108050 RepID=M5C582_THACB|nr:hypothetical protein BN14_05081 [Rhizoctonia solani AG-1 IB]
MGYQPPLYARADLDYSQMIEMLHDNRDGWRAAELKASFFIDVPYPKIDMESEHPQAANQIKIFVDGVFAYINQIRFTSRTRDIPKTVIHYHQLASVNKGVECKHWSHELAHRVVDIVIQPEADLLVLLVYNYVPGGGGDFDIHIRTMSTNEPHPLATLPIITLNFTTPSQDHLIRQTQALRIYGRMISIHCPGDSHAPVPESFTMVWNWITGARIVSLQLPPEAALLDMVFVSEEYIASAIHRDSDYELEQLGCLEIYRIPHEPGRVHPFAKFMLPGSYAHAIGYITTYSREQSSMARGMQLRPEAKVFELPWEDRQICIRVSTMIDLPGPHGYHNRRDGTGGWLCVSSRVLLKLLEDRSRLTQGLSDHNEPHEIPWDEWGSHAAWIPMFWNNNPLMFTWGHRCAFILDADAGDPTKPYAHAVIVHIVDLDQSRNRDKVTAPAHPETKVTQHSYRPALEYREGRLRNKHFMVTEDDEIFRQALRPDAYCTHAFMVDISKLTGTHLTTGPSYYLRHFDMVMIDDKHIVIPVNHYDPNSVARPGLFLYGGFYAVVLWITKL